MVMIVMAGGIGDGDCDSGNGDSGGYDGSGGWWW